MRMSISPDISELSPGDEVELTVKMANDGSEEITPTLELAGLSADLWRLANPIPVIAAGEIGQTSILIRVPADTPPGDRRISVTVRSPLDNSAASAAAALRVGAGDVLAVEASPQAVTGRKGAGLSAIVHNRGSVDLTLRISGSSQGAHVEVKPEVVRLPAGQSAPVKARFTRARRSWFRERKHGVVFDVRGHTVPATTTAMFVQRPTVPPVLLRSIAVLVALAVWASAVFVIFTSMAATEEASTDTGEVIDTGPLPPAPPVVLPDPDADPAALNGQVAPPVVIQGAVEGPRNPADTVVVVERVSFGDQGTTNGTGKVAATATPVALASGAVLDKVRTTTDDRGRFRVASGLRAGAFYRVSALRAGFEIRSVVVSTATSTEIDLALTLVPANGQLSGRVVDSTGEALGGAIVEATQGLITYRTVTSSSGEDKGRWTIDALATPATYLITVRQSGFASQTLTVDLDGGQALGGVDAVLTANMGTIRGQITYRDSGVGAITVNLVGEAGARETTTLTDGPLAGSFTIPSLPYGTYLMTFSGDGWMTQSREVTVDTGDVPVSVRDLVPSTGIIQGVVAQQTVAGGCNYPDTTGTISQSLAPSPCGGVGVTVVNDDGIWRTTTATSDGSFLFSSIPAGEYSVKFERFGYLPEFYTVRLMPGDVLNVPGDATYDSSLAAVFGGADRPLSPLNVSQVQLRVSPPAPLDEGVIEGFIRDVTAQEIAFDNPVSGAFRNGWDTLECNGVGSPVHITIVGAARTNCTLLAGGGYRLTNVMSGVQRVRFSIAGFDEGLIVARVSPTDITSGGVVNLMPRASVTLNLAGGGDAPVGQAIVFVGPLAVDGSTLDDSDPSVSTCAVSRPNTDPNEIWRVFDADSMDAGQLEEYKKSYLTRFGICSTSDLAGDALFPAALGPGGVDVIVPVNTSDPTTASSLARTVPLDHRQLVRTLVVAAGENVRLDLRLRRYPVILGNIQQPRESGPGFERVDVTTSGFPALTNGIGVAFCEVDMTPLADPLAEKPCLPFTDPKVQPRISVGLADGLSLGQFRIDRIPPNEGNTVRVYRLQIITDRGRFQRDPGVGSGFENLTFGEDRSLSVIMSPTPIPRIKFELRDGGTDIQLTGGFLQVTGTTEFRALDAPPFQEVLRLQCPGPDCGPNSSGDDGRPFIFTPATVSAENSPFDGAAAGTYFSLGSFSSAEFRNVFRPGSLEIEAIVPGYAPLKVTRLATETTIVVDDAGDPTEVGVIVLELDALPRRVEASIVAAPALSNYSGLTVALTPAGAEGGTPISTQPGSTGQVVFPAVAPGAYLLSVSGPGIFPLTLGGETGLSILAGTGAQSLGIVDVDRQLTLEVGAFNLGQPIAGASAVISREDGALLEDGETSQTLLTCTGAVSSGGATGCVRAGEVPFTGLRAGVYIVAVSAPGFLNLAPVTTSVTNVTQKVSLNFDRFGAVTGTVLGRPGFGVPEVPLSGAQIAVMSGSTVVTSLPTESDGRFSISNLAELEQAREYRLRITFAGYEVTTTAAFTVTNNATTALGDIVIEALPAIYSGTIYDGSGTTLGLSGVRVVVDGEDDSVFGTVSDADGKFSLRIPAGRTVTVRFENLDDEGRLLRPTLERTGVFGSGGATVAAPNVHMVQSFGSITGTVLLRDRDGAASVSASTAAVTVIRTNADSISPLSASTTVAGGAFSVATIRTGTYQVSVSAEHYVSSNTETVFVAKNGSGHVVVVLNAAPRAATFVLISDTGDSLVGVTVSASSQDQPVQSAVVGVNNEVTLEELQPGDWTFVTEGGEDIPIPHINITNGEFSLSPGTAPPTGLANNTMTRYAQITGSVVLDSYDSSVTVPAFDWTVSNAALTATGTTGTAQVRPSQTDTTFTVWVPNIGPWDIEVTREEFSAASVTGVTADFAAAVNAGIVTLFPAPREVTVQVTSEAVGAGPSGLAGLTLVATASDSSGLDPVTAVAVDGSPGSYKFENLTPAAWTVTTTNAPALSVPHVNATASVTVPLGIDGLTVTPAIIEYAALNGSVTSSPDGAPLAGVTVTVTQSAETVTTTSLADSSWTVGVVGTDGIEISWSKVGYETVFSAAATRTSPVVETLTVAPRNVTVTVTNAPEGLQLEAAKDGVTVGASTDANGEATFENLTIGVWSVDSVNAATFGLIELTGAQVTVSVATELPLDLVVTDPIYELVRLEVSVMGRNFEGGSILSPVSGATVLVSAETDTITRTTLENGKAFVFFDGGEELTVTVSAVGYSGTTSAISVTSVSNVLPIELVANTRTVTVQVTSSASPSGIEAVTVTATSSEVGAPGSASVVTASDGTAGFTLAPGEWTFAVTGATATGHLDIGPDGEPTGAPRVVVVPAGDQSVTVEVGVVLQPFDATVTGTVFLVTGDDSASVSAVTDPVLVRATSGDLTREVTSDGSGVYSLLLTGDRPWQIAVQGFAGTTTTSVTPTAGASVTVDVFVSALVRNIGGQITGASGEITITASANGFTPITQKIPESGPYEFVGLNATVTWTITFSDGTTTVTRFVAPGNNVTNLDQDLADAAVASIVVNLTDTASDLRAGDLVVTVTLSDPNAFPRIAGGSITETVTLTSSVSLSAVTFPNLVTTSGSPPFTITVTAEGYASHTRTDVSPGTPVEINLVPSTRTVVLTLEKNSVAVSPASAQLTRTVEGVTSTLSATMASNVATFSNVAPGTWDLVVPDYAITSVDVPIGDGDFTQTVQLQGVAASIVFFSGTDATTSVSVVSGSAVPSIEVRLLDAQGAILPVTVSATMSLSADGTDLVSVVPGLGTVEFIEGEFTIDITGTEPGIVTLTVALNGVTGSLTITVTPADG